MTIRIVFLQQANKGFTYNIARLNMVLEFCDFILEFIERDLVVLNDQVDLKFLDAKADGDEFRTTPYESVLFDRLDM